MQILLDTPRSQGALAQEPYDRWIAPSGVCMAEFRRDVSGFHIRFPGQADFLIEPERDEDDFIVTVWAVPGCDQQSVQNLIHNAIQPILGNHSGGLFLHGSAVLVDPASVGIRKPQSVAFLGLSRGGKTTLAGSFAKAGFPFMTEDVIDLQLRDAEYWLQPKRSKLRLFSDSARHLLGEDTQFADEDLKQNIDAGDHLPFADCEAPLSQIYILGQDHDASLNIQELPLKEALGALLPHAFVLDVEDQERLQSHFFRMADLCQDIPCYALDFKRHYDELPRVRHAILESLVRSVAS